MFWVGWGFFVCLIVFVLLKLFWYVKIIKRETSHLLALQMISISVVQLYLHIQSEAAPREDAEMHTTTTLFEILPLPHYHEDGGILQSGNALNNL